MMSKILKSFIAVLICLNIAFPSCAITLEELTSPQPPAQRLGTEDVPEKVFKIVDTQKDNEIKAKLEKDAEIIKDITYADLSLNKISKEIISETEIDQTQTLEDIKYLWVGAAQNSETVKFIIYKLSNPDEDKPNPSIVKKIIQPLATVGSMAGIGMGNPMAALSTIMGSTMLGQLSVDNKDLNYRFSKVNDADMVVLIRKIEELQRKIVNYYFDYISARKALIQSDTIVAKRRKQFLDSNGLSKDQVIMVDAYYRAALQTQSKVTADYLSKRAALEQIVGVETMSAFEEMLAKRDTAVQ